jgi:hypothetical protein
METTLSQVPINAQSSVWIQVIFANAGTQALGTKLRGESTTPVRLIYSALMVRSMRWRYVLPSLHFLACSISYVGLLIPSLQFLGILFTYVLLADLPISLPAYFLAWKYPVLAVTWVFVAGTLWWYLIGRAVQVVFLWFARRNDIPAKLTRNDG